MADYRLELRLYSGAPPSPNIPTLQNITMRRGAETLAGAGGVPLGQLMQVGGNPVTSWAMSGDVSGLTINSATGAITPTAHGSVGTATRTIRITGTNADGLGEGYITLVGVPNAYSVSRPAEAGSSALGAASRRAALGGKTIILSKGMWENLSGGREYTTFNLYNTHAAGTRITLTSEFDDAEENWTKLQGVRLNGCHRFDVRNLRLAAYLPESNTSSGNQSAGQLRVLAGSGGFRSTDVTVDGIIAGPDASIGPLCRQWVTGVEVSLSDDCLLTNIEIDRCYNGVNIGESTGITVETVSVDRYCNNAITMGGEYNHDNTIRDAIVLRNYANPIAPGAHLDALQIGSSNANQSWTNNVFENIRIYPADGNTVQQGPFFDDVGFVGGAYTGRGQNGYTLRNIFYQGAKITGPALDVGLGWVVENMTCVRLFRQWVGIPNAENGSQGGGYGTGPSDVYNPDATSHPWAAGSGTTVATNRCVAMDVNGNMLAGDPDIRSRNSFLVGVDKLGPLPPSIQRTTQVDADLVAYYLGAFEDPDTTDADFASMNAQQIDAMMRMKYSPKIGGVLDRGDGTFDGMWGPGGVLNEGQAFY